MLKHYETVFILNPVLPEPQVKDTVEKFKNVLTSLGATVTHEENWGLRTLAYPIDKKKSGFYIYFEFTAPSQSIKKLEIEFVRDENVLRFLTTVLDKHALEYNEKRRNGAFKNSNKVTA
jgi:small subunit ribosomal protein S6